MAYTSVTDIANIALNINSSGFIQNIDGDTKRSVLCKLYYDDAYRSICREVRPFSGMKRAVLVSAGTTILQLYPEYSQAYLLPDDCLLPVKLISNKAIHIESPYILTDDDGNGSPESNGQVIFSYYYKNPDISDMQTELVRAIGIRLGLLINQELTGGKEENKIRNADTQAIIEAKRANADFQNGKRLRNPMWGEFQRHGVTYGKDGNASWEGDGSYGVGSRGVMNDIDD
jgi:hypothetical protein